MFSRTLSIARVVRTADLRWDRFFRIYPYKHCSDRFCLKGYTNSYLFFSFFWHIKTGSRIGRQPNAVKFHCAIEIRQLRSIRGTYPGHLDIHSGHPGTPGPTTSTGPNAYTPFSVDIGQAMDTITNPGSLHNRSDVESPKYSPDTLTSTYANTRDLNVWENDQKPPLSLLLFLPRPSDPIDVTSSCSNTGGRTTTVVISDGANTGGGTGHGVIETGETYLGQDTLKLSQFSPPTSYHPTVSSGAPFDRFNLDAVCLRQPTTALSLDSTGFGEAQSSREAYLPKHEDLSVSVITGCALKAFSISSYQLRITKKR